MAERPPVPGDPGIAPAAAIAADRRLVGALLIALSATSYATVPIFARLAYDDGSTPLTMLAVRYVVTALALLAVLKALRRSPLLPARRRLAGIGMGICFAGMSYGYLGAVQFIPVSLAVLVFFTYPLLVAPAARIIDGTRLGLRRCGGLAAAFAGLALSLGASFEHLAAAGVGLAALAAVSAAAALLYGNRVSRGIDGLALTFQAMASSAALFLPLALLEGLVAPGSAAGWIGLVGVAASFALGAVAFFAGIALLDAVTTAAIQNLEPVVSIVLAVLVLGESLAPLQAVGIGLVLAAIAMASR